MERKFPMSCENDESSIFLKGECVSATQEKEIQREKKQGVFAFLKETLAGTRISYTTGNLNRAVLALAVPMMLEMALESVFSVVDIFWVGRLGEDAVAAVGLAEALLTLVFAVQAGLSSAATAMVARRIGEGDRDRAAVDAVQALGVGLAISLFIAAPAWLLAPTLLGWLGASRAVVAVGAPYAHILLGTSGVIILISLSNAIFRGAGDAAFAMRLLLAANVVNLILDPLLIFGVGPFPKLGIAGPAVATLIGRGSAVLYQFYRLGRGSKQLKIERRHLRFSVGEMWQYARVSSAGVLQFLLEQGSWLAIIRIVSLFGANAIAAYTIAFRITGFALMPSMGLSNAAATLVGQNIGADLPDRARKSVWRTGVWNFVFLGTVSLPFILFAPFWVGLFTHDPAVIRTAAQALRLFSCGNLLFSFGIVFLQAFNGAGDTLTPTYINLVGLWILEIPLAWYLGRHTHLRLEGIFVAILIAQSVAVAASGYLFVRGRWARVQLLK